MEKYGLNAAGNLARGALFCGQLCQRLQKAAVIRGGGMAFGLGQQPADFASGGAAIYLGLVAVAADTNLSGFDLAEFAPAYRRRMPSCAAWLENRVLISCA